VSLRHRRAPLEYHRILVPLTQSPESERAVDAACSLAAEHHASIAAVTVLEISPLLPLDAHMLEEEDDAHQLLDRAEAVGATYGIAVSTRILRAREAATAIVDQAMATDAEIIVIGGARKRRARARAPVVGTTVKEILRKAPCRVMLITSAPEASSPMSQ
jgi:nucleotide-binding universal stress UspA family protein